MHVGGLRELKDARMIVVRNIPGDTNNTKNVTGLVFNGHIPLYVEHGTHITKQDQASSEEDVQGQKSLEPQT